MKVLLVNGSPHEKGCTYTALSEAASVLSSEGIDTEIFWLGTKPVSGCLGCGACGKLGRCAINDAVNEFAAKAAAADGFLFGSPVHYASASGTITSFMDRLFFSAPSDVLGLKPAAAIVSARRAGTTATLDQLNKYFTISQMPVVSSGYWNMVHGFTPDQVRQDLEGMQVVRTLARNMAWLLRCIEAGKKRRCRTTRFRTGRPHQFHPLIYQALVFTPLTEFSRRFRQRLFSVLHIILCRALFVFIYHINAEYSL